MATKKKTFDAIASSRRWRTRTARRLHTLSTREQDALLRETTERFFAVKPKLRSFVLVES